MILLYYYTSLWQMMQFDCLNSVCSMSPSKGPLNSVTQKVFRRQYKVKEEFNNLNTNMRSSYLSSVFLTVAPSF